MEQFKLKKVELLAPAGNYESFIGAVNAGADAVYLGGEKFGARAYADNFTEEEICKAIHYAHLFNRKVYLTVNTLIKETEFVELIPYLTPFYEAGLDGVIVQDIGAFLAIREAFPHLKLHVSTQMTVTGSYAANMLKEMGAVRIVPARELSLKEIRSMKEETGLELETFIHGAMCYCYSGQCLFSSILGGRSGNRGRCAQPCRLPYQAELPNRENKNMSGKNSKVQTQTAKEQYPLSLKDMCSIAFLPKLIEAGIDSFKIEGRMKKPEYAAGVTAIYRKYIDLYYEKGVDGYKVAQSDIDKLSSLYIRSGIQDGYYFKHNGADMVTLSSPAYNGSDEKLLERIRRQYIENPIKREICIEAVFEIGKEALLTIKSENTQVTVKGAMVQAAAKQPITDENIKTSLLKLGNTAFTTKESDIILRLDEGAFYSLKALNELRRMGVQALEEAICNEYGKKEQETENSLTLCKEMLLQESERQSPEIVNRVLYTAETDTTHADNEAKNNLHISVNTCEQLEALLQSGLVPDILYMDSALAEITPAFIKEIRERFGTEAEMRVDTAKGERRRQRPALYIALPYIVRQKDLTYLETLLPALQVADGVLVRNTESYYWLISKGYQGKINTDAGIYTFNRRSLAFWQKKADICCLPYELNKKELRRLIEGKEQNGYQRNTEGVLVEQTDLQIKDSQTEQIVYGRIPLMLTANCVAKTLGGCRKGSREEKKGILLTDRYRKQFPVETRCEQCYNIIYNTVPLSLHEKVTVANLRCPVRVQFTVESAKETREVLGFWKNVLEGNAVKPPYAEYTLGHEKRGVE
ncbi:MAG: U32 family peptidase [Lachnospiraceae bacterium]|nr:U32 family peptidase [Lachnospiraceae bacterium]